MSMQELMTDVMTAAAKANPHVSSEYKQDRQYASPFACESAMPGNYFMQDDLTTPIKEEAKEETAKIARVGRAIAEIAEFEARDVDSVNENDMTERMWHGVHEMVWHRWGKGGFGEGLVVDKKLESGEASTDRALEIVENKGYSTLKQADTNGGIDLVESDGTTHQVKVKDDDHKPDEDDIKDADKLWWVNSETGEITDLTP